MVKRKTVHKVYKKSSRKTKKVSRKTKRGGKNSRTFKKKKRTQKRKLNKTVGNRKHRGGAGGLDPSPAGFKEKMSTLGHELGTRIDHGLHRAGDLRRHDTVSINPNAFENNSDGKIIFLAGEEMLGPVNRYCVKDIVNGRATLMQWQFDGLTNDKEKSQAAKRVPALRARGIEIDNLTKIKGDTNADRIYMEACKKSTSNNKYNTIAMADEYNRGWNNGQLFAAERLGY